MTVWALFDSGNGSYTKGVKQVDANIDIYPIGIDIENKNNHFINLNLADYSRLFGDSTLFDTLDKLPKPDLIIASPPCESWSNASAMDRGNACWKQEQGDSLFQPQEPLSVFTVRDHKDFDKYQFHPDKQLMKRKNEKKSNDVKFQCWTKSYNERSNIPQSLVCEIFEKVYKEVVNEKA